MQKLCRPISVAFIAALLALTGSCSGGTFSNGSCEAECDVALCMRCENDTCVSACGEEQVCDGAGVCVDAATCDPICDSDECMVCDDGDCVTACEDWEICDEEGHCEEDTSCEPACDADECMVCDHGDCVSACDIGEECDGFGTCVPVSADAPLAHDDEAATDEDSDVVIDVLANDTDPNGDDLRVVDATTPARGTAVVLEDGHISYSPPDLFNGTDTFHYTITDDTDGISTAQVTVTVRPVGADYYVALDGSDEAPGTLSQPFATLGRARTAVQEHKASSGLPDGGITVWLRGGLYELSETFVLGADDGGEEGSPVTYAAYPREEVRITNGARVDPGDFTLVDSGSPVWSRLNPSAQGNVYQLDLTTQAFADHPELLWPVRTYGFIDNPVAPMEVFVDAAPMQIGRWPDADESISDDPDGFVYVDERISDTEFTYTADRPDRWTGTDDVWFDGLWNYGWAGFRARGEINTATNTVTLTRQPYWGIHANRPYYVYNLLEEITQPGEWYLDRDTSLLYLWPPGDLAGSDILISLTEAAVIEFDHAERVNLQDLVIEGSRFNLVEVAGSWFCTLQRCTLRNAGSMAVRITGGHGNGLDRCEISGVGGKAVWLEGGNRLTLSSGNHFVTNSDIHDYARLSITGQDAVYVHGAGHRVEHNELHDAPGHAVYIWGNNHTVAYNDIHHVCRLIDDGGAIYSQLNWGFWGNRIEYNFIHHVDNTEGPVDFLNFGVHGIYFDGFVAGLTAFGNILYEIRGFGALNSGRNNTMENNVFVNCQGALFTHNSGDSAIVHDGSNRDMLKTIQDMNYQTDPWASAYPALAAIPNDWAVLSDLRYTYLYPEDSVFSRNLGYGLGTWISEISSWGRPRTPNPTCLETYAEVAHNVEDADPLFEDPEGGDFSLRGDSPAFDIPGFVDIPFELIGIQPEE